MSGGGEMRVLWTHNFDPSDPSSGIFMHRAADGLRARGIDLELAYLGNLRSFRQIRRARREVKALAAGFDIVHAQYGSACSMVTGAVQGARKVLTVRGSDWQTYSATFGYLYLHTRLAAVMTWMSLAAFDCVLAVSDRMNKSLRSSRARRVETLPSPIDLDQFRPLDKSAARAGLPYGEGDRKWVLFNSRHLSNPVKRYGLAKAAFELAQQRRGDLVLRLATDLKPNEVVPLTAASDVILCTSEYEGWPNCIKEALACDVPFVATDVSDLREIAERDASCQVCCDNPEALADGICAALDSPPSGDLRRFVQSMGIDEFTDRLLAIYRSLLDSGSR